MTNTPQDRWYQRRDGLPSATIGDVLLMMSVDQGQYFSLNSMGSRIWALLERPITVPQLVQSLVDEYDVTPAECGIHVSAFLDSLEARDLLRNQTSKDTCD